MRPGHSAPRALRAVSEHAPVPAPRACLAAALVGFSDNTRRAIRSDFGIFDAWCRARPLPALPAAPATLAAFVDAMAASRAPATVRRYVASIAAAHRVLGHDRSATKSPAVRLALQRIHRAKGRRQAQALALTWPLRQRLLAASGDRLIDVRNRALLALAYDTMLRRSELAALHADDLAEEPNGAATLLVRRGKTDPEGGGAVVYAARDTMRIVRAWLRRGRIADGFLFRSLSRTGTPGQSLDPSQIPRIFKAMARAAGLPDDAVDGLSGHSARVGAAQDMIASGVELAAILQAGRWKTTAMVNRYGERLMGRRSSPGCSAGSSDRRAAAAFSPRRRPRRAHTPSRATAKPDGTRRGTFSIHCLATPSSTGTVRRLRVRHEPILAPQAERDCSLSAILTWPSRTCTSLSGSRRRLLSSLVTYPRSPIS